MRRSILFDARADMLVYGMGEAQTVEIARRLEAGQGIETLDGIPGTAVIRKDPSFLEETVSLPAFEAVADDPVAFNKAFKLFYGQQNPHTARPVVQAHGDRFRGGLSAPHAAGRSGSGCHLRTRLLPQLAPGLRCRRRGAGAGDGAP